MSLFDNDFTPKASALVQLRDHQVAQETSRHSTLTILAHYPRTRRNSTPCRSTPRQGITQSHVESNLRLQIPTPMPLHNRPSHHRRADRPPLPLPSLRNPDPLPENDSRHPPRARSASSDSLGTIQVFLRLIPLQYRLYTSASVEVAQSYNNLGEALLAQDKPESAEEVLFSASGEGGDGKLVEARTFRMRGQSDDTVICGHAKCPSQRTMKLSDVNERGGCRCAFYCSTACRISDWKIPQVYFWRIALNEERIPDNPLRGPLSAQEVERKERPHPLTCDRLFRSPLLTSATTHVHLINCPCTSTTACISNHPVAPILQ
ncbi:hypothetical protein LshimejAT787_0900810 [Lyophyllum shimeji]|uniref:Uncharacterized protein n=1 Tax=Lyophyllum shimeji TaxID=47721 RepID=A0A9P3PSE1_LYOSH|nr:hypothetical protein LshimejAT787_0900810 [Lyophyllum shimeji]